MTKLLSVLLFMAASAATPPDDFVDANEEGPAGDEDADEWIDEPTD